MCFGLFDYDFMSANSENNKRIAKNTFVPLHAHASDYGGDAVHQSGRVEGLGVEDFGIL